MKELADTFFQMKFPEVDDSDTTGSTGTDSDNAALKEEAMNVCYLCYGKQFKDDNDFYVNHQTKRLTSAWYNLKSKMRVKNSKEKEIITHLGKMAAKHAGSEDLAMQLREVAIQTREEPDIDVTLEADWN